MANVKTFSAAVSRSPMRVFQWVTVAVCLLVIVSDGIDMQLLGIIAPAVIKDFGVDRSTFGIAMSSALIGFALGAWTGGKLGDVIGRRYSLALAAIVFALATAGASQSHGIWSLAIWRLAGGLGFGAAFPNAIAGASEWLPERWRPVVVSTLSVGTPLGGTVAGWIGPHLTDAYGWRGAFLTVGSTTLLLGVLVLVVLRDSPSFLMAKGKPELALRAARRVLYGDIELTPEHNGSDDGNPIGVLHRTNLRFNTGVGIAFAASALVAFGILNWSTTFLTASGFTLDQAGNAVSAAGIAAMIGSVCAGMMVRRFGSRRVMTTVGVALVVILVTVAVAVETLPPTPDQGARFLVVALIGAAAAVFSASMGTMYVIIALGYPQSCRSAGIGFGIFISRLGAISASGFGGALLDLGKGSVVPFFAALSVSAMLISAAAFVIDRHIAPMPRPGRLVQTAP